MANNYILRDFQQEARQFAQGLVPSDKAVVVALHGDLGAGKTTFTQIMAHALGINNVVVSPTFVIQKSYSLENQVFKKFIHIDAYRLEEAQQLEALGWRELINDPANLIVIEWPENVVGLLALNTKHVYFKYIDEDTRSISYNL